MAGLVRGCPVPDGAGGGIPVAVPGPCPGHDLSPDTLMCCRAGGVVAGFVPWETGARAWAPPAHPSPQNLAGLALRGARGAGRGRGPVAQLVRAHA